MGLEFNTLSQKDKFHVLSLIPSVQLVITTKWNVESKWNLKYATNESTYETDPQTQSVVAKCGGVGHWEGRTGSFGLADTNYSVLLPGKSHGRRSLVGCSPWGC